MSRYLVVFSLVAAFSLVAGSAQSALITLQSDAALAGAAVIDFDAEPTADFGSLTIDGVTFSTLSGQLSIAPFTDGGDFGGSGQELSTRDTTDPSAFRIDFSAPASAFGMQWAAASEDWRVSAYDSLNVLIETVRFTNTGEGSSDFYGIANTGIAYVLLSTTIQDWVKIDDFRYVTQTLAPVPVPSAAPLFLAGLGLMGWYGRRRKIAAIR